MGAIRVLHMPVTNSGNGIVRYILENRRFIDNSRFVFDYATRSPSLDFAERETAAGGTVHYLSCSAAEDEERFRKEMTAVLERGYDVVHLHTSYWNGYLVEEMAMRHGCPVVIVHSHSTMIDMADPVAREAARAGHERIKRQINVGMATHFCACSPAAADWLFGDAIPRDRIRILRNAVDVDAFAHNLDTRKRVRNALALDGCFVLGHAGRFTHQKNHAFLIDVFVRVARRRPDARLLLAGDGPLMEDARSLAARHGLYDRALFLGRRRDITELMQAMDVYLQPSRFEGLGLSLIEAQTSGLRCLASVHVPPEAGITPSLSYLPLDAEVWAAEVEAADGYVRRDQSARVAGAGYSLKEQIKHIEKLYEGREPS